MNRSSSNINWIAVSRRIGRGRCWSRTYFVLIREVTRPDGVEEEKQGYRDVPSYRAFHFAYMREERGQYKGVRI
jgi:hypothetical protein